MGRQVFHKVLEVNIKKYWIVTSKKPRFKECAFLLENGIFIAKFYGHEGQDAMGNAKKIKKLLEEKEKSNADDQGIG